MKSLLARHHKRWYVALAACLLIAVVSLCLSKTGLATAIEAKTVDYRFRQFSRQTQGTDSIVLVSIDQGSLDFFAGNGISWPWPRDFYAHLTAYLASAGARAIILFDLLFYEPDLERDEERRTQIIADASFAELSTLADDDQDGLSEVEEELEEMAMEIYEGIVSGRLEEYEEEADKLGLLYAARAGYDPKALGAFLSRLSDEGASSKNSHYTPGQIKERIGRVRSFAKRLKTQKEPLITERGSRAHFGLWVGEALLMNTNGGRLR